MRQGDFVLVDGIRTHYFEAGARHRGKRPSVLLLHSAEYGGAAEFSWEFNIEALAQRYHVLAPDHLGFGLTGKVFDFDGQFDRRIMHIRRFLEAMDVRPMHVVGSSMSGGMTLTVAARKEPDWPIISIVSCSGGGEAPNNEARKIINSYDGTREHMRRILQVMFADPKWANDETYLDRRWKMAAVPGAWEATSAARFKAPFREAGGLRERDKIDYRAIRAPALIMAGKMDTLRKPGYTDEFVPLIPQASLHVFERAGHMGNIECAAEFNERVLAFLDQQVTA
ncbi:MAG: alpha/beta fold hydrolase [Xanthobacteraceae bacterium]